MGQLDLGGDMVLVRGNVSQNYLWRELIFTNPDSFWLIDQVVSLMCLIKYLRWYIFSVCQISFSFELIMTTDHLQVICFFIPSLYLRKYRIYIHVLYKILVLILIGFWKLECIIFFLLITVYLQKDELHKKMYSPTCTIEGVFEF